MIAVIPTEIVHSSAVCRVDLSSEKEMVVHAIVREGLELSSGGADSDEPYLGFEAEVQQQLNMADSLETDDQRQQLYQLFYEHQSIFSRDSYECGVTDLHSVRIPTDPNAPRTYIRQYKIPLTAFESIQEILDSLLEKQVIRECNSTYYSPLWPVVKPSGKWRLTIDYWQLNKQQNGMKNARGKEVKHQEIFSAEDVNVTSAFTAHQYVTNLRAHLQKTFAWAQD
ncbi:hypothetical protein SKAU_G00412520 [Synaphobranchus kaupii]|uniref:Uncharacterized protein n=1 Tax=Synaphobranchus kaupii TaxID=118154 RepID=A0A9Q1E818_SYNKA|nr:hypothetical protein SKAU_G00412520 [Synaphobranchus kaupii]